jgi:hypothetical protein
MIRGEMLTSDNRNWHYCGQRIQVAQSVRPSVRPFVSSLSCSPKTEIRVSLRHGWFQPCCQLPFIASIFIFHLSYLLKILPSSSHKLITELCLHKDRIATVSCHIWAMAVNYQSRTDVKTERKKAVSTLWSSSSSFTGITTHFGF